MIVRILGEGQFEVDDGHLAALNELDAAVEAAVDGKDEEAFEPALSGLLDAVRNWGKSLPEDTLIDDDGSVLTGLHDGRILRVGADGKTITTLADTGGRPLGLEWLPDGKVLICDANRGLLTLKKEVEWKATAGELFPSEEDEDQVVFAS